MPERLAFLTASKSPITRQTAGRSFFTSLPAAVRDAIVLKELVLDSSNPTPLVHSDVIRSADDYTDVRWHTHVTISFHHCQAQSVASRRVDRGIPGKKCAHFGHRVFDDIRTDEMPLVLEFLAPALQLVVVKLRVSGYPTDDYCSSYHGARHRIGNAHLCRGAISWPGGYG